MFGVGYVATLGPLTEWWGAFDGEKLAAVAAVTYTRKNRKPPFLSMCAVRSSYRGLGLQRRLIRARLEHLRNFRKRVTTYVHAENYRSLLNLAREKFQISHVEGDIIHFYKDLR